MDIITIKQAATLAGKDDRTIRRWIKAGLIKDHRPPNDKGLVRIDAVELRSYLATLAAPAVFQDIGGGPEDDRAGQGRVSPGMTASPGTTSGANSNSPSSQSVSSQSVPSQGRGVATGRYGGTSGHQVGQDVILALQAQIAMLHGQVEDLRQDRDRQVEDLRRERDRLVGQVERLTGELRESREARAAVERELAQVGRMTRERDREKDREREGKDREAEGGGVIRGLLKSFWR